MNEKIEITEDTPLQPGDKLEIHFKTVGLSWIQLAQTYFINKTLKKKYPNFEIQDWGVDADKNTIVFKVLVLDPNILKPEEPQVQQASVITAGVIIAVILGVLAPIAWYFTVSGIYKLTEKALESPTGKIALGAATGIVTAILAIVILSYVKK